MKRWLLKIWRWFFPKKKPIDTIQDFQVLQKAPEKWVEPEPVSDPVQITEKTIELPVKPVFNTTPNQNKYWRRFKRDKKTYWKKFYSNGK